MAVVDVEAVTRKLEGVVPEPILLVLGAGLLADAVLLAGVLGEDGAGDDVAGEDAVLPEVTDKPLLALKAYKFPRADSFPRLSTAVT